MSVKKDEASTRPAGRMLGLKLRLEHAVCVICADSPLRTHGSAAGMRRPHAKRSDRITRCLCGNERCRWAGNSRYQRGRGCASRLWRRLRSSWSELPLASSLAQHWRRDSVAPMRELVPLANHLLTTLARLLRSGGIRRRRGIVVAQASDPDQQSLLSPRAESELTRFVGARTDHPVHEATPHPEAVGDSQADRATEVPQGVGRSKVPPDNFFFRQETVTPAKCRGSVYRHRNVSMSLRHRLH